MNATLKMNLVRGNGQILSIIANIVTYLTPGRYQSALQCRMEKNLILGIEPGGDGQKQGREGACACPHRRTGL